MRYVNVLKYCKVATTWYARLWYEAYGNLVIMWYVVRVAFSPCNNGGREGGGMEAGVGKVILPVIMYIEPELASLSLFLYYFFV